MLLGLIAGGLYLGYLLALSGLDVRTEDHTDSEAPSAKVSFTFGPSLIRATAASSEGG